MDTGAWWAIVHGVAKSRTWLKWLSMLTFSFYHTRYFADLFIVYCLLPAPTAPLQILLSILWLCSYLLSLSPSQLQCFLFHYNIVKNNILLYKSSHRPLIISKNLSHLIRCYILIRLLMPITNLISCHAFCIIYVCWEAMFSCCGQPINLIMCPSNSTLGVYPQDMKTYPHKHMYMIVQSSVLHHSPQMEVTELPMQWWMDKREEASSYHEILFSSKKGRTIGSCYHKNVLVLRERSQMQATTFACFRLQKKHIWGDKKQISHYLGLG